MTEQARKDPRPELIVDQRPWGRFEQLTLNEASTVKIITVEAGQRLSLQRHQLRDELWTILDAPLDVEVGDRTWSAQVGEQVWIPRGISHRVGCSGDTPARFLEVGFGTFDESDIERLSDDYQR